MVVKKESLSTMSYPVGLYLKNNINIINEYIKIIRGLKKDKIELICTGSSGAIIAGIIASKLKCNVIYVKKKNEPAHTSHGDTPASDSYTIVVDDFVCSGQSVKRILDHYKNIRLNCLIVSGSIHRDSICFKEEDFDLIFCKKVID